jgi:hypothetical protein
MNCQTPPTAKVLRTDKGQSELRQRGKDLSGRARVFLFAADGERSYQELLDATGSPEANQATLDALIAGGYMTLRDSGGTPLPVPASASPVQAAQALSAAVKAKEVPMRYDAGKTANLLQPVPRDGQSVLAEAKQYVLGVMTEVLGQDTSTVLEPLLSADNQSQFMTELILCYQLLKDLQSKEHADKLVSEMKTRFGRLPTAAAAPSNPQAQPQGKVR